MAFYQRLALFAFILLAGIGCNRPAAEAPKRYSLLVMSGDHRQYILQTDSLDGGTAWPIRDGAEVVSPPRIWYYTIVKNGYYYFLNSNNHFFVRNKVEKGRFVAVDSVSLPGFTHPDNSIFFHPDSLLIVNSSGRSRSPRQYAKVNIHTMKASIGALPLPLPEGDFSFSSIGFASLRPPYLWLGYTYHYSDDSRGYGSADTVYVAALDYPSLQLHSIWKDARSTYPGNVNTAQQNTFTDEKGDFYFLTCPGIVRGGNPDQPTAIYRIKAGAEAPDSAYFFNISTSAIHNHAYGLWYLGNGKAIVRSERKDLFKTFEEHYLLPHIEFYVVDLQTQAVQKLELPLDRGSSRTCVLVEAGNAYITINDGKGNNDIWIYTPSTQHLKKGLHLAGDIDYIFRLERLYE